MTNYTSLTAPNTQALFFRNLNLIRKVRVTEDMNVEVRRSIEYILTTIGTINAASEFTSIIDGITFDEIHVPVAFAWLIQPASVRYVASRKFADLRDRNSFFTSCNRLPFSLDEWNSAWQVISNLVKKDFIPGEGTQSVSSLRLDMTVTESNFSRLVIDESGASAPGFDDHTDAIAISALPTVESLNGRGFDVDYADHRMRVAFNEFSSKSRN